MPPAPHSIAGGLKQGEVLPILGILLLFGFPLFTGLGAPDMGNDESIYSFAVQGMVEGGSWLTPAAIYQPENPPPFVEKPPLKMWITAAGISSGLLPNNHFGLRFSDALFGLFCLLYIYGLGKNLRGPPAGLISALLFFTLREPVFIHGFRSNNMDSLLMLAYAAGVYHFLRWTRMESTRGRAFHIFALALFFTAGFMSKFVAALFLPMLLAIALILTPAWREILWRDRWWWISAAVFSIALIAPWFVYQHLRMGEAFWEIILGDQVLRRVAHSLDPTHLRPWFAYFLDLGRSFLRSGAILLIAPGTLFFALRSWKEKWPEGRLILLWATLPLLLMSCFSAKLSHYVYPYLIPFVLMGGVFLPEIAGLKNIRLRWLLVGSGLVTATLVLLRGPGYLDHVQTFSGGLIGPVLAVAAAGSVALLRPRIEVLLMLVMLGGPIISWGTHMERILGKPYRPLGALHDCLLSKGAPDSHRLADILKPEGVTLLHSWAFYGNLPLAGRNSLPAIQRLLASPSARPIWMSPEDFERLRSRAGIPEACRVLRVAHIGFDHHSPAILILPACDADCGEALLRRGAASIPGSPDSENSEISGASATPSPERPTKNATGAGGLRPETRS